MAETGHDREEQVRAERARAVGLFRYSLIREAADERLSTKQRGRLVRALADGEHVGPFGTPVRVSRETIDRWVRAWRHGGFDALVPTPRRVSPRTPAEVLDLAAALKRENPARTAVQVAAILRAHSGWAPNERTLQRHFVQLELNTRPDGTPPKAFGRFEAAAPNERWTGDALHGPLIDGRKAYLFAFLDDHSRLLTGYRWGHSEDTVRLEAALRNGLAARGVPGSLYLDNGSAMVDKQLLRACASLGIRLVHSKPGQPAGRGKIEKVFRTVREQFLVEIADQRGGRPGRAEPAVHRVGGDRLPPPGALRDRADSAGPLAARRHPDHPGHADAAARGVLVVGVAHRHQDRHRVPARQPLRSRRRPRRPARRVGLRPLRPHRHRGSLARPGDGQSHPAHHRPARAPQGPPRHHRPGPAADRDRLPAPGRGPARCRAGRAAALLPTRRPARPRPAHPARHRRAGRDPEVPA